MCSCFLVCVFCVAYLPTLIIIDMRTFCFFVVFRFVCFSVFFSLLFLVWLENCWSDLQFVFAPPETVCTVRLCAPKQDRSQIRAIPISYLFFSVVVVVCCGWLFYLPFVLSLFHAAAAAAASFQIELCL